MRRPSCQISVEKSRLEFRICEYAVRSMASPISCTMDSKRWVRTLTVIGSAMALTLPRRLRLRLASSSSEAHLLQDRAAKEAVRIGQRFDDLEVVVAIGDEELHRFACRLHCRGEVARLTLEFRSLERAVRDDHGGVELVEMALRAQRVLRLVGELDVAAARGEAHRLEVEHAAAQQAAL